MIRTIFKMFLYMILSIELEQLENNLILPYSILIFKVQFKIVIYTNFFLNQ